MKGQLAEDFAPSIKRSDRLRSPALTSQRNAHHALDPSVISIMRSLKRIW
jgi:hypothetical protein